MPDIINALQAFATVWKYGNWLASMPSKPGIMAYGATEEDAIERCRRVFIESGE